MLKVFRLYILITALFITYSPIFADDLKYWEKEEYASYVSLNSFWANRFLLKNQKFNGNENVLYIGFGDGASAVYVAKSLPKGRVICIEPPSQLVDYSKREYKSISNLSFVLEDVQDEHFYDDHSNSFDVIVSFFILNWVDDQKSVLDGIYKSLKKGGKFYLHLMSKERDPIVDIAEQLMSDDKYKKYFIDFTDPIKRFSVPEFKVLLQNSKLHAISIVTTSEQDKVSDIDGLIYEIKSWLPQYYHLKTLNPALAETYVEDLAIIYTNTYPPKIDGTITLYSRSLEVIGDAR